jgi:hypothetical protein
MKANFDDELNLQDAGQAVRAEGPLRWSEMPGIQRVTVAATIDQNPISGSGSRNFDRPANGADSTWWCVVRAKGGVFQPGHALAAGAVVVVDPAGGDDPWPWPERPLLKL